MSDFELFPSDPEREARSREMNRMILNGARRGERPTGGTEWLSGVPEHIARLNAAQDAFEAAKRSGDPEQKAYAEHLLDRTVETAGAARLEREGARNGGSGRPDNGEAAPPAGSGFDGGVQRKPRPAPSSWMPRSANDLFRQAFAAHRQERREADTEQTIFVR